MAGEFAFREEPAPHDPDLHSGACSPYWYLTEARGKVAIYSVSGWYDGSAFANGAISRYLTMAGPHDRLLLGPWDHGARGNGSPFRGTGPEPKFPLLAEILRFFDEHLAGMRTGLAEEAPIHFHTVHEETWKAASRWPPHSDASKWYLHEGGVLSPEPPAGESRIPHQVRFTTGTGSSTRYERLGAVAVTDFYRDWNERQERMLHFTTAPFDSDVELTGHAIVSLRVSTSERDASVFAYLSEVDPSGRAGYITEGALRMLHRATSECPPTYRTTWPFRTFRRVDARLMVPDVPETLRFALLPVSWRLMKGNRLRLSIAGSDADHFAQVPHGRPPRLEVVVAGREASFAFLPLARS
jgi:putative CocE/NonD family hydrolase